MYTEQEIYLPFSGTEFLNNYETLDHHPYSIAFREFLENEVDPDIANKLAFGIYDAIAEISEDPFNPILNCAIEIFEELNRLDYWQCDREPENFLFAY